MLFNLNLLERFSSVYIVNVSLFINARTQNIPMKYLASKNNRVVLIFNVNFIRYY